MESSDDSSSSDDEDDDGYAFDGDDDEVKLFGRFCDVFFFYKFHFVSRTTKKF